MPIHQRPKKHLLFGAAVAITALITGCSKPSQRVEIESFPAPITLTGHSVSLDTIPGMVGNMKVVDNNYYFYLYDSDNFMMKTDTAFHPLLFFAKKGDGPGEVQSVGYYGPILSGGKFGLMETPTRRLYSSDIQKEGQLTLERDFLEETEKFSPWQLLEIEPGRYVSVPGDFFQYGLTEYDASTKTVKRWPICFDFGDSTAINQAFQGGRTIDFNSKRGLVGETYKSLPMVILHNTDGGLDKVIFFNAMPELSSVPEFGPSCYIPKLVMTDNYIYVSKKTRNEKNGSLYVFDYDGNPIAHFILAGENFTIDAPNRRIITLSPNAEDESEYVMWYSIPDIIEEP